MKSLLLSLIFVTSCSLKKSGPDCVVVPEFEKKPLEAFGLTGIGYILIGAKNLTYIVVEGVVIPTVACYPSGILDRPHSFIEFNGLSAIYRNCYEKQQIKLTQCPDVKAEAKVLEKIASCYEVHGDVEKAKEQRGILQEENAFSGCLEPYSKAAEARK